MSKSSMFCLGILWGALIGIVSSCATCRYLYKQAEARWAADMDRLHQDYIVLRDKCRARERHAEPVQWPMPEPRRIQVVPILPDAFMWRTFDFLSERIPDPKPVVVPQCFNEDYDWSKRPLGNVVSPRSGIVLGISPDGGFKP